MKYIVFGVLSIIVICSVVLGYFFIDFNSKDVVTTQAKMYVTIEGAVNNPNQYYLDSKSKLIDLIYKAGGLQDNADLSNMNLNQIVKPELTYTIPFIEYRIVKQNLNAFTDSSALIKTVKSYKIPSKVAERVINHISVYGPFSSWEEVDAIENIGVKTLNELKKYFILQ